MSELRAQARGESGAPSKAIAKVQAFMTGRIGWRTKTPTYTI